MNTSFWKAGHAPTLFAAFLYFDLSFMVWYVLGPLGVQIAADLGLTTQQRAMMVATPILAGGKHVVVVGGGDTASDCVGTAFRQGAQVRLALCVVLTLPWCAG